MKDVWAVVVGRTGPSAKTRLAGALGVEARAALASAMLADVLRAARGARLAGVIAVLDTATPIEGVVVISANDGLNRAVEAGVRAATVRGAKAVVVVPGDVPLVTVADLEALVTAMGDAPRAVVVATDRWGEGTNAIALRPPALIAPAFGADSAARHIAAARAVGAPAISCQRPGLAIDVDTPADLDELRLLDPGGATGQVIAR